MNFSNVEKQLQKINIEDLIWIIYFFIVIAALVSNYYERIYVKDKQNKEAYKTFKIINIGALTVGFIIYLYFVVILYDNISQLKDKVSENQYLIENAKLIAAILFLVGGFILLLVEIQPEEEPEIAII